MLDVTIVYIYDAALIVLSELSPVKTSGIGVDGICTHVHLINICRVANQLK